LFPAQKNNISEQSKYIMVEVLYSTAT